MNSAVDHAVDAVRRGGLVVVSDDEGREDEADLILAAEHATAANLAFLLRHTSGFVCVAVTGATAERLELAPMARHNDDPHGTNYLVGVDAREGTTTGISAADRALACRVLADPAARPGDLRRPGHLIPLRAHPLGLAARRGHTEAGVALCHLAGLQPAAVLCELTDESKTGMLRGPAVAEFGRAHGLPVVTVGELAEATAGLREVPSPPRRADAVPVVRRTARAGLPTRYGEFTALTYADPSGAEHLALVAGEVGGRDDVLVRLHSECLTGDLLGSERCDCGGQLDTALRILAESGGVLIYQRGHEGRGIGLGNKLRAYDLQERVGLDTVEANRVLGLPVDARDFTPAAAILADLGVCGIALMTNNPDKLRQLEEAGVGVRSRVPLQVSATPHSLRYLETKRLRLGHLIDSALTTPLRVTG